MISEISSVNSLLWTIIWQSTLFLTVGLFLSFIMRHHSARAHRVLLLSITASVLVPLMTILVRHLGLGIFEAGSVEVQAAIEEPGYETSTEPFIISPTQMFLQPRHLVQNTLLTESTEETIAVPSVFDTFFRQNWRLVLLFGWLAMSFILTARLLVTFLLGVCLLNKAEPLDCDRVTKALIHVKAKLGIRRDVRILGSRIIKSPVIWCWRRKPVLLVPKDAGRYHERTDWTGILCHELAHWKRHDHINGLIAELAACVIPWQLLMWWAKTRMINLSENACDDWVIATGKTGTDYAEALLDLTPGGQMAFVPAVVRDKNELAQRIRRILKDSCGNPRTGLLWAATVFFIACSIAVTVAFAQTRPARTVSTNETDNKETTATSEDKTLTNTEKIFEVHNDNPSEIVQVLQVILNNQMAKDPSLQSEKEQIILVPVPEKKWIVAKAPVEAMELITEWITKLDSGYPPNKLKDISLSEIKDKNQVIEKFFYLKHSSPSQAAKIIQPLLSDEGYLSAEENTGTVLVIDKVSVLLEIEKLLEKLDNPDVPLDEPMVHVNLSSAGIDETIKILMDWTGKPVIPSEEAKNLRITIYSPEQMRRSEAIILLYKSILQQGFIAEIRNNTIYIKPISVDPSSPLKLLGQDESLEKIQDKDAVVRKIFKLKNYGPSKMGQIIYPFINSFGYITADESNGTLMVTDNVKTLMRIELIIKQFDESAKIPATQAFKFKYTTADRMADVLNQIIKLGIAQLFSTSTTIVPDPRSNMLIVKASPENMKTIKDLLAIIDQPVESQSSNQPNSTSYFFGLKDNDSERFMQLLKVVFDDKVELKILAADSRKTLSITSSQSYSQQIVKLVEWYLNITTNENKSISMPVGDSDYIGPPPDEFIIDTSKNSQLVQSSDYEAIQLQNIDTVEAAEYLKLIIAKLYPDSGDKIAIQPLPQSHQILVFAKKQLRQTARNLIQQIDKPSQQPPEYESIAVRYIDFDEAEKMINEILTNEMGAEYRRHIIIQPLKASRQILIFGKKQYRDIVKKLLKEIDTPSNQLIRKTFQLKYADVKDVKEKLDELFGKNFISKDNGENTLSAETVIAIAYPSLKQLVVLASKEKMKELEKLIGEWDSPIMLEPIYPRIYTINHVDKKEIFDLLSSIFSSLGDSGDNINNDTLKQNSAIAMFKDKITFINIPDTKQILADSQIVEGYQLIDAIISEIDKTEFVPFDKDKAYNKILEKLKTIEESKKAETQK